MEEQSNRFDKLDGFVVAISVLALLFAGSIFGSFFGSQYGNNAYPGHKWNLVKEDREVLIYVDKKWEGHITPGILPCRFLVTPKNLPKPDTTQFSLIDIAEQGDITSVIEGLHISTKVDLLDTAGLISWYWESNSEANLTGSTIQLDTIKNKEFEQVFCKLFNPDNPLR